MKEYYALTWPGKREAIQEAGTPPQGSLRPCVELSKNFETTQNLYIEGDNLEVLKLLQKSYMRKVKMIYIDPPYNTGHDFIYRDNFSQDIDEAASDYGLFNDEGDMNFSSRHYRENTRSNPRYHSDWCSMIYPRLKIAHNLLTDDGVIFISIDDNEQANLRKICDEIFGENNFIFQIAWRRTDNQPNIGKVARVKEYIMCFAKDIRLAKLGKLPLTDKAKAEYRYHDEKGTFRRAILLDKTRGRHHYPVTSRSGRILNGPWMKTEAEFKAMDMAGEIYWTEGGDEQPYGKIYLQDNAGAIANDFWGIEYGTNQRASLELEKLLGHRYFDFPKPVSLLYTLLMIGSESDSLILDFFSGSSTTAHAVMQLNHEDSGTRKFIMVQLPEDCQPQSEAYRAGYKTICDIGRERIRRAGESLSGDTGFRVLKLDSSNFYDVYVTPEELTQDMLDDMVENIKPDRSGLDLLFGFAASCGLPLSLPYRSERINGVEVHVYGDGEIVACFEPCVPQSVIIAMSEMKPVRIVFRDSCFAGSADKLNALQLIEGYSPDTIVKVL